MTRPLLALLAALLLASAAPRPAAEPQPFALTGAPGESVTVRIEAEDGGVIEAVSAAGHVFRLTIPADALYHDATITLTPLTGARLDGAQRTLAVRMEPKGLQFFDPAVLTIEPATPFAEEVWWFESLEGRSQDMRPGLVAKGGTGLLVWHFSEGAAASGPGLGAAVQARGVSDAPGSTSWLEWQRNVTQQQYEAGKIDKITHDAKQRIIQERLAERQNEMIREALQRGTEQAAENLRKASQIAERGDLNDIERLGELLSLSFRVGRQCQLLGLPECDNSTDALRLMIYFRGKVRERCEDAAYGATIDTTVALLRLERLAQLLGAGASSADFGVDASLMNCLFREWNGTATRDDGTEITVKRLTCDVGIQGLYEYSSKGGVETNFRLDLRPPKNDEVQYAVADVTAAVQAGPSCTVTCRQGIAASIGTPERPLIGFNPANSVRCTACPTSGPYDAGFLAVNRIELKPGPLCDPSDGG